MINAVIRKLVNLIDSSASEGQKAGLLVDEYGRLHVTSSGASGNVVEQGASSGNPTDPWYVRMTDGNDPIDASHPLPVVLESDASGLLAKDATLTGGTAKAILRGGAKGATVATDVTSTANGADHQGADVAEQFAPVAEDNTRGVICMVRKPLSTNTYAPTLYSNMAAATKANIKNAAGNVLGVVGTNGNASVRYLQLHNKASAPAATEVPLYSFAVAGGGNIVIGGDFFTGSGGYFSTGIGFAWSTTASTFTDSATSSEHTFHCHYA